MPTFEPLHTPRLIIRRLRDDDLPALVAYRADPDVMRWQLWEHYDEDAGRELITAMTTRQPFEPGSSFQFAVALRDSDALIGDLYLKMDEAGKQAEIGYTFALRFQRRGLATEAVRALLDHAFTVRGMHRLYGITDPRHARSIKLMRRIGMRQEAHLRENLWFKGEWADDVMFAILDREWGAGAPALSG